MRNTCIDQTRANSLSGRQLIGNLPNRKVFNNIFLMEDIRIPIWWGMGKLLIFFSTSAIFLIRKAEEIIESGPSAAQPRVNDQALPSAEGPA
jgi:hypothetical protein